MDSPIQEERSMRLYLAPLCLLIAACGGEAAMANPPQGNPPPQGPPPKAGPVVSPEQSSYPPAIINGEGNLVCTISSKENGRQTLTISSGDGLAFDVVVSPIVDGTVSTKGPDKGGSYR